MLIHKNMVGSDVTLQLQCCFTLAYFTWNDATSWLACYLHVNQYEFYGVCCDCKCFTLILVIWSSLHDNFMYVFCSLQIAYICVCIYSFNHTEMSIFKHVISMVTRSRTSTICKLLSVKKKKAGCYKYYRCYKKFSLQKESFKSFAFPCQLHLKKMLKVEKCARKRQKQQNIVQ
jgi:hypothetical protein